MVKHGRELPELTVRLSIHSGNAIVQKIQRHSLPLLVNVNEVTGIRPVMDCTRYSDCVNVRLYEA